MGMPSNFFLILACFGQDSVKPRTDIPHAVRLMKCCTEFLAGNWQPKLTPLNTDVQAPAARSWCQCSCPTARRPTYYVMWPCATTRVVTWRAGSGRGWSNRCRRRLTPWTSASTTPAASPISRWASGRNLQPFHHHHLNQWSAHPPSHLRWRPWGTQPQGQLRQASQSVCPPNLHRWMCRLRRPSLGVERAAGARHLRHSGGMVEKVHLILMLAF